MGTTQLIISSDEPLATVPGAAEAARAQLRRQFSSLAVALFVAVVLAWVPVLLPTKATESIRFVWVWLFYWVMSWLAGGIGIFWIFRTARRAPPLERETRVHLDKDARDKLVEVLRSLSPGTRS
jgi:hypothetical protein